MEDVCCPAKRVAISMPVISSSLRYLPPYTCSRAIGIRLLTQHHCPQSCEQARQQRKRISAQQQKTAKLGDERGKGSGDL